MATQQPPQQLRNRRLPWKYVRRIIYILVIITLFFFIAGGTTWVLMQVGIIHASWADKLFTILAGLVGATAAILAIFGIFQFILALIPNAPESSTTSSPSSTTIQNIINVPPTPPVLSSLSQPSATTPSFRSIIGLPPPRVPKTIQQRENDVKAIYDQLTQPDITAIALIGIGGIGKSTLAALIYRYAEKQRQAGNGPFTAKPLWLTVTPAVTMADLAGTLVEVLGKPMLDLSTLSPQSQAAALFNALNTVDKPCLVILDQFENFLDWQTGKTLPDRVGVGEWLDTLNSQPCRCHLLLTSRPDPQGTREYPPTYLQTYHVEGLEEAEGIELLRKQDVTGTETELRTAVIRCDGHAYALTLLASLLRARKLSLPTLLDDPVYAELWSGKVAQKLLDSIYKQLDELQRKLLIVFSVYREPVPLEAAQALIDNDTKVSKEEVESTLDALLNQHLLQALGEGRYQLHLIVASYTHDHFVEGDEQAKQQALKAGHARAAQYYLQRAATSCPPREQRRQISDVHDLIEAIWQYCQAEQRQEAYNLTRREGIFNDLNRWGGNAILLELLLLLLPDKWHPKRSQSALIYNNLSEVYYALSKFSEALQYCEQSLRIYKEAEDRKGEGEALSKLGLLYKSLSKIEQALDYCQQALEIRREVGDRHGEGATLNNLGSVYYDLGDKKQALDCYQRALYIRREVGDRRGEGATLNNLGSVYYDLGDKKQALDCYQRALEISREVGDRHGEGVALNNLGSVYHALGDTEQVARALAYYQRALEINREVGDRHGEGVTLKNLGSVYYDLGDLKQALFYNQQALYISREVGDRLMEGNKLHNIGHNFDTTDDASPSEKKETFSRVVLKGISKQQGQSTPVMQSDISGASDSAAIVGVGTIVGNMFKYGNNFMIQRGFGPGPYGLYTLSYAIVTLVASIFNLGLDDAMVRYTSVYRGKKQPKLLRGLAIFCSALVGVAGMLGAVIVYFMLPYIASVRHSVEIVPVLLIMIPIIPLVCMQVVWNAGLQGFKEFKWRVLTQRLLIPGVLLVLLIPVLIFFHTITSVAIALLLSIMFCTIVSLFFFFRKLSSISQQRAREYDLRKWIGFAIPNFLTSIVDTVLDSVDTVLLVVFAISYVAIGQYGAAIRIAIFVSIPLQFFNTIFAPTIAELYFKGDHQKLSAMFKIVTKWALTFSLPIFWVVVLFAQPLLGISGIGFVPAWPLLVALAIGNLINVATGSVGYMLLMTGHQKITFLNSLVAIVFNIALGVILIPPYGAMGVAIATGVALSVVNLMRLFQVYIFLKMTPFRLDTLKPIGASMMSAVLTGGFIYWLSLTNLSLHLSRINLSIELALIPVFIVLYVGLLALFRISPEDQIVVNALRRKLKRE